MGRKTFFIRISNNDEFEIQNSGKVIVEILISVVLSYMKRLSDSNHEFLLGRT